MLLLGSYNVDALTLTENAYAQDGNVPREDRWLLMRGWLLGWLARCFYLLIFLMC